MRRVYIYIYIVPPSWMTLASVRGEREGESGDKVNIPEHSKASRHKDGDSSEKLSFLTEGCGIPSPSSNIIADYFSLTQTHTDTQLDARTQSEGPNNESFHKVLFVHMQSPKTIIHCSYSSMHVSAFMYHIKLGFLTFQPAFFCTF